MIAAHYGYSIDQFMRLTMRQLVGFSKAIQARLVTADYTIMAFHAKLGGHEMTRTLDEVLQSVYGTEPVLDISKEQDDKLLKYMKRKQEAEREALRSGRL